MKCYKRLKYKHYVLLKAEKLTRNLHLSDIIRLKLNIKNIFGV